MSRFQGVYRCPVCERTMLLGEIIETEESKIEEICAHTAALNVPRIIAHDCYSGRSSVGAAALCGFARIEEDVNEEREH